MTKLIHLLLSITFLIAPFVLKAQQLENQTVENIEVVIHTTTGTVTDSQAILKRMSTKNGGIFSQTEFDEDLKALSQDYDRVEPVVKAEENHISIILHLWPKPIIRSIKWHGNHKIPTCDLQNELAIKCFSIYERQAFNQAFHKLKAYYTSKGYFEAELDYQVSSCSDSNEVDITIDIKEGRSGKIQEIKFVNFCEREESEILNEMTTKKYNIFLSWYTNEGIYNQEGIEHDQLVITNYLQNEGFADAQVRIDVNESCKSNRIIVTITADRGEQYYFGSLSFEGNCVLENNVIDNLFLVRPSDPYSPESIRETIELITDAYGRLGYIDASIDFEPKLVEGQNVYNVHFKIEEGEQYHVGLIKVFGNVITQTPVILHETLMIPGEVFNIIKLKKTEERLRNMGYFKNVNVYIVKGTESSQLGSNYRDVYIEVEETTTGNFSFFAGYSSVEELFGGITITERNFNQAGFFSLNQDGLCALRGGGEYVNFTTQIGQKSRSYTFSWTKPYFMDSKWTVGFDISNTMTRYISKEYDLGTSSLNLRAAYNINQFLRFGLHYRLKNGDVDLHTDDDSFSSDFSWNSETVAIWELRRDSNIKGLISAVGMSLSYDSTNHPIKPSEGFRSKLYLEYAGVGGDHTFLNVGYYNSYYYPVGSRTVLKYRADLRFIQPVGSTSFDTMPLDERIFLGGDYTVRGYRPYRLGPQYGHTHVPRGGLSLQLYSVEMNRRIIEDLDAFIFMDAGHLSDDTWEFGRLSVAVGYGIRFKLISSIPPLTIGMGYPMNPKNRSEVKKFFLSVGGTF